MTQSSGHLKVENPFRKEFNRRDLSLKILYMKTVFAVVVGLLLGYFKVEGILGFMVFLPLQYLLCQGFCTHLKVPDYMVDRVEMFTEQILPSFGVFLVFWTTTFSVLHA